LGALGATFAVKVTLAPTAGFGGLADSVEVVAALATVNVKVWVASGATPLAAEKVIGKAPAVPVAGVPDNTPVAGLNVTPVGNVPDSLNVGDGVPVATTVNEPDAPTVNVAAAALVMAGGWPTTPDVTANELDALAGVNRDVPA